MPIIHFMWNPLLLMSSHSWVYYFSLSQCEHRPENLWNYPLITYLRWPNNIWTKFGNSGHCVQAASTASSVVLCPLYLQLVCWRSVRKKAPKIVWSQYLASGEKRLTCCYLTSFYLFIFATVAYDLRNDKLSQRVNCDLTKIQEIVIWNWCTL